MSRLSDLILRDDLTDREKGEARELIEHMEQNSLAVDGILGPTGGVTVDGSLRILGDLIMAGSRLFYDGAGNLQFRMITGSNYTLSDGNFFVNQPSPTDTAIEIHESNVRKASLAWDVSLNNLSIENFETGLSGVVFVVADNDGIFIFHRRDTNTEEHKFPVEDGAEIVLNQQQRDIDFRVEGNTDANNLVSNAGTDNIGMGTAAPAASAKLEISSTVGALLLPRMTTTQRDALTAVNGMVVYNSTNNVVEAYENGSWVNI